MAFQKYEQIDKKLNEDKRLINLHAKWILYFHNLKFTTFN
jgi:hypothetical protein